MANNDELLKRITCRADVLGGSPVIRDLGVSVDEVLSLLTRGVSPEAILDDYPVLELDDVFACTAYAREAIRVDAGATTAAGDPQHQTIHGNGRQNSRSRRSLRDLAMKPLEERHRAIQSAGISVDADDTEAWDGTAGDGLDH